MEMLKNAGSNAALDGCSAVHTEGCMRGVVQLEGLLR